MAAVVDRELAGLVGQRITAGIAVQQALLAETELLVRVAQVLIDTYRAGGQMLLFGNGGSASDAQHIAAELTSRFYIDRPALPASALTANISALTGTANDYAYERVFSRQIEAFGRPGDVAIGMSTSGHSPNVLEGLRLARRQGLVTVGLTGASGGLMVGLTDYCVRVPSQDTPRVQEAHLLIGHIWCELIERALFGGAQTSCEVSRPSLDLVAHR